MAPYCPLVPNFLVYYKAILEVIALFAFVFGLFMILNPRKTIDLQIEAYRRINWKMEPIRLKREIRNTRVMGVVSVLCSLAILFLVLMKYD